MSAVIAECALELDDGSSGFVRLYACEPADKDYACEFHLSWNGFESRQRAHGVDSWQAVQQAMRAATLYISETQDYRSGRLRLYGYPMKDPVKGAPSQGTSLQVFFDNQPLPRVAQ